MKREDRFSWIVTIVIIISLIVGALLALFVIPSPFSGNAANGIAYAAPADAPIANVELVEQSFNHIEVQVAWQEADNTAHTITWGDGTETAVEGSEGIETFTHDFAYEVGGMTSYTIEFTVNGQNGTATDTLVIEIDDRSEQPTASIEITDQNFNSVQFRVEWTGGSDATHRIDFGDGSETGVQGLEGVQNLVHDFAYVPGELTSYWVAFTVIGAAEETTVAVEVVIDDRHSTYSISLPVVLSPAALPPSCTITAASVGQINHIEFEVSWNNGSGGPYRFVFGDGAETTVGEGANGTGSTSHDYSYVPGGIKEYEVTMWMSEAYSATCSQAIVIDDTQH